MIARSYVERLVQAEILAPMSAARGIPIWLGAGLSVAERLIECYAEELEKCLPVRRLEHSFFAPADRYRHVFPDYENVYALKRGNEAPGSILRPDWLVENTDALRLPPPGPVMATGGLLRRVPGRTPPLFRDRYIWPAVQVSDLVPLHEAHRRLNLHAEIVERAFARVGLATLTVSTGRLGQYSRDTLLILTWLPGGLPTVVATLFVLSETIQQRLRLRHAVLDIGFTGKVIALIALQHSDRDGLVLPSVIAPVEVGVLVEGPRDRSEPRMISRASATEGLRTETISAPVTQSGRRRAERRFARRGTPIVATVADDVVSLVGRAGRGREQCRGLRAADVQRVLTQHDAALFERSRRQLARLRASGLVQPLCPSCEGNGGASVFGFVVPHNNVVCRCGSPAREALMTDRFY